jgi:hypothetical protein
MRVFRLVYGVSVFFGFVFFVLVSKRPSSCPYTKKRKVKRERKKEERIIKYKCDESLLTSTIQFQNPNQMTGYSAHSHLQPCLKHLHLKRHNMTQHASHSRIMIVKSVSQVGFSILRSASSPATQHPQQRHQGRPVRMRPRRRRRSGTAQRD